MTEFVKKQNHLSIKELHNKKAPSLGGHLGAIYCIRMKTNLQKNTDISYYVTHKDTKGRKISLHDVFEQIRTKRMVITDTIRACKTKEERDFIKAGLSGVTFAGTFSTRSKDNCIDASGLICLDFDYLKDVTTVKDKLTMSKYCFAIWVSPSGKGLKMLVKIPLVIGDERYKEYYNAALEHYGHFKPDKSTKDFSRLCYLSSDPNVFLNENAVVFTKKKIAYVSKPKGRNFKPIGETSEDSTIRRLFHWWMNSHWDSSNRNTSLYKLAAALCEFGVSQETAWSIIQTYQETDLREYELRSLVKSAYKRVSFNTKELA